MTVCVTARDWTESRWADLEAVPTETTVGELIDGIKDALALAPGTPYELIRRDEKLPRGLTLEQVGIEDREVLTVAPLISAG
jgi:hypothetical protein